MGWLLLDIAVILILVLPCIRMAKKGFIKVIFNLTANIITIVLVAMLSTPATQMFMNTSLGERVSDSITQSIVDKTSGFSDSEKAFDFLPEKSAKIVKQGVEDTAKTVNREITESIMRVLTSVILFILLRLLMSFLFIFIESVFKMPVLSKMNLIVGGAAGLINGLLIVYIASAIIGLNFKWAEVIRLQIDDTLIYQHFYYNNVLIDLLIN